MDLPIQCLERHGLPHGKKILSVDATVCLIKFVACLAHKFGLCVLKLLVTLTYQWLHTVVRANACQNDCKSASSVHISALLRADGVQQQCIYRPSLTFLLYCTSYPDPQFLCCVLYVRFV